MLTFDFRNQLLGDWPTAKGFLVAQLDRLYASLANSDGFLSQIDPTTNAPISGGSAADGALALLPLIPPPSDPVTYGVYIFRVPVPTVYMIYASAAGGGGAGPRLTSQAGSGGGAGASIAAGSAVTLIPGKTYQLSVGGPGAGGVGADGTPGGDVILTNVTDHVNLLSLGGGGAGTIGWVGGAGGIVTGGVGGVSGGNGGGAGTAGGDTNNGAGGGGGGGDLNSAGGRGGNGSVSGAPGGVKGGPGTTIPNFTANGGVAGFDPGTGGGGGGGGGGVLIKGAYYGAGGGGSGATSQGAVLQGGIGMRGVAYLKQGPAVIDSAGPRLIARPDYRRVAGFVGTGTAALADFGMAGVMTRVGDNDASDAMSWWREYRTTAVNGNMASLSWGVAPFKWCLSEHLPVIRWHVKTGPSLTALRLWCGLFDTIPSPGSDTQLGQVGILFRYSTVAGDPGWVGFASKFLGGNANSTTGLVAAIAVNTIYDLQIRVVSLTSVGFSVNGGPEVFLTTSIPILGQYGGFGMGPILAVETREAVVKSLFVSRGYFEAN